jgi:hypothetical protein
MRLNLSTQNENLGLESDRFTGDRYGTTPLVRGFRGEGCAFPADRQLQAGHEPSTIEGSVAVEGVADGIAYPRGGTRAGRWDAESRADRLSPVANCSR